MTKPHMHGLSYILGYPTDEATKEKVRSMSAEKGVSPDRAWMLLVNSVVQEMQDEDSPASLSSILTLVMERPVIAPKLDVVPYEITTDGVSREHPMICFRMRNVIDADKQGFIEIDRALADQLSQIFQTTFECDFVETVFVQ